MNRPMFRLLSLAIAMGLGAVASSALAARVERVGNSLQLIPERAAAGQQLRITGPAGFLQELTVGGGAVRIDPPRSGWVDGSYQFELIAVQGSYRRRDGDNYVPSVAPSVAETGHFRVERGTLVVAQPSPIVSGAPGAIVDRDVPPTLEDQVIPDDLIVQGSTCIGLDCVNNESFGFDTLRLKENNTRIKFDDTSVTAGFAATDWQLTANDNASGGPNKFSIEDITAATVPFTILGAAPTNSIFVAQNGKVGFRTATPVLDVHLYTGDTPAIRLDQNGSSGFTAQTWDVAGNEANFFVRDVTSGSRLPFRIRPGAPTSSIDISASGKVGVGTASPDAKLHVAGTDGTTQLHVAELSTTTADREMLRLENQGQPALQFRNAATSTEWRLNATDTAMRVEYRAAARSTPMIVQSNGNVTITGTLSQSSDRNSKENFRPLDSKALLAKLAALPITEWNFKHEAAEVRHVGPMAQDFHAVFGLGERDDRIAPLDTSGIALAAVQGLQQELVLRDQRIADLEARLQRLDTLTQQLVRTQARVDAQQLPVALQTSCPDLPAATGL